MNDLLIPKLQILIDKDTLVPTVESIVFKLYHIDKYDFEKRLINKSLPNSNKRQSTLDDDYQNNQQTTQRNTNLLSKIKKMFHQRKFNESIRDNYLSDEIQISTDDKRLLQFIQSRKKYRSISQNREDSYPKKTKSKTQCFNNSINREVGKVKIGKPTEIQRLKNEKINQSIINSEFFWKNKNKKYDFIKQHFTKKYQKQSAYQEAKISRIDIIPNMISFKRNSLKKQQKFLIKSVKSKVFSSYKVVNHQSAMQY